MVARENEYSDGMLCQFTFGRLSGIYIIGEQCYAYLSNLVNHNKSIHCLVIATIKINSKVEEHVWNELKQLRNEFHQNNSGLLTETIENKLPRSKLRGIKPAEIKSVSD